MKSLKTIAVLGGLLTIVLATGCNGGKKTIVVGATPSPHAEILNSKAVQDYVKSKGYSLKVKVYQDYITPNKALEDGGLDANYFQHLPYLNAQIEDNGYDIVPAAYIHCEPLSLYSKTPTSYETAESFTGQTISIINDVSNATRALELLKLHGVITSYSTEEFDIGHLSYESTLNVTIQAIGEGLLTSVVEDDGLAVIPGNFALTKWGATQAESYKVYGETVEAAKAKANLIAVKRANKDSEKTNVLVEALGQAAVGNFITENYGSTVLYCYEDLR